MELEHERDGRLKAEETIHELHVQLERANARVAELMAKLAAEESARADLEHMRRALHAARTNAALDLMGRGQQPRHLYNPIAAPRHQFGPSSGADGPAGGSTGNQRTTPAPAVGKPTRSSSTPRTRGTPARAAPSQTRGSFTDA